MSKLQKLGDKWVFRTEADLEEFIWANLKSLFGLLPLRQQHCVNSQFCDILAASNDNQLVIIELKNQEDRYVVQQLTRYYHALSQEKPYDDKIDCSKPVRLIAIAPSFHRDNLIDREYNQLSIDFWAFEIIHEHSQFILRIKDINNSQTFSCEIPYQVEESSRALPPIPKKISRTIANLDETVQERIRQIRNKILNFDERIKERNLTSGILYGKTKNCSCAEFRVDTRTKPNRFVLFLWLPHPSKKCITRMEIYTKDWQVVYHFRYSPKGFQYGASGYGWKDPSSLIKLLQILDPTGNSYGLLNYAKLLDNPEQVNSLDLLVEVALEKWLDRLS